MKRVFIYLFLLVFLSNMSFAQKTIYAGLSNYRIPLNKKGCLVAKPFHSLKSEPKLQIIEDTSHLFRVKDNTLYLKKNRKVNNLDKQFVYTLKLSIENYSIKVDLVEDGFIKNKVIAHRGAWKNQDVSQNSLGSLQKAIDLGCEGSEFDIWLSSDGVPVLSHDPSIGGHQVENTSAAVLTEILLKNGETLPTLEQYLQLAKIQNKTTLILEIKSSGKGYSGMLRTLDSIVNVVTRWRAQGWLKYISFSYDALLYLRKADPYSDLSYLAGDKVVEVINHDKLTGIDYSFYSYEGDGDLIKKAHALGLTVNVWTVNDSERLIFYLKNKADMITTDEPELLLKLVHDLSIEKN